MRLRGTGDGAISAYLSGDLHVVYLEQARLQKLGHCGVELLSLTVEDIDISIIILGTSYEEPVALGLGSPEELFFDPWEVGLGSAVMNVVLDSVGEDRLLAIIGDLHLQMRRLLRDLCVGDREAALLIIQIIDIDRSDAADLTRHRALELVASCAECAQVQVENRLVFVKVYALLLNCAKIFASLKVEDYNVLAAPNGKILVIFIKDNVGRRPEPIIDISKVLLKHWILILDIVKQFINVLGIIDRHSFSLLMEDREQLAGPREVILGALYPGQLHLSQCFEAGTGLGLLQIEYEVRAIELVELAEAPLKTLRRLTRLRERADLDFLLSAFRNHVPTAGDYE